MNRSKRFVAAALFLLAAATICFAQESDEKTRIEAVKKGLGYRYTYEAAPLVSWNDFYRVMADSPNSLSQVKKAKASGTVSVVLGSAGGFLIGWPIGTAIAGGDPNWWLAAAGGGVAIVGVVFSVMSAKQLKKSVDSYNDSIAWVEGTANGLDIVLVPSGAYLSLKY